MVHWQEESIRKHWDSFRNVLVFYIYLLHIHYYLHSKIIFNIFCRKGFLLTGASAQYHLALTSFGGALFSSLLPFPSFWFLQFLFSSSAWDLAWAVLHDSRRLWSVTKFFTPPTWYNLSLTGRKYEKHFFNILKDISEKIACFINVKDWLLNKYHRLLVSPGFYCLHASSKKLTFLWKFHGLEKCDNPNTNKHIITNLTAK